MVLRHIKEVYGIGDYTAKHICKILGISPKARIRNLNGHLKNRTARYIQQNYIVNNVLKKKVKRNILQQVAISSYRGKRHSNRLPCHGQRTRTNAKTQKRIRRI